MFTLQLIVAFSTFFEQIYEKIKTQARHIGSGMLY
jgi:hypothetical protein